MFKDTVSSREELRAIFGAPMERALLKERASLDQHCRAFIARSPFVLLATSGGSHAPSSTQWRYSLTRTSVRSIRNAGTSAR